MRGWIQGVCQRQAATAVVWGCGTIRLGWPVCLKLKADTSKTPWWELYGGLEVPVGVRVDLLGYKKVADYQVLAIGTKQLIAQAPSDMVPVPAGTFQMGCDLAHNGGYPCEGERPLHTVYLDAYRIDRTEVTNTQYAQCVAAGGCTAPVQNSVLHPLVLLR